VVAGIELGVDLQGKGSDFLALDLNMTVSHNCRMDIRVTKAVRIVEKARKVKGLIQADVAALASTPEAIDANRTGLFQLGQEVRSRRKHLGFSQARLSQLALVQQSEISRVERGVSNITLTGFLRILDALHCRFGFIGRDGTLTATL
jgi:ribosome-binding protein aMBF1 (putative translation factor)